MCLKDGNEVVDLGATSLRDTFGNPDDVARLLFAQSYVRVKDSVVELADERQFHQLTL